MIGMRSQFLFLKYEAGRVFCDKTCYCSSNYYQYDVCIHVVAITQVARRATLSDTCSQPGLLLAVLCPDEIPPVSWT